MNWEKYQLWDLMNNSTQYRILNPRDEAHSMFGRVYLAFFLQTPCFFSKQEGKYESLQLNATTAPCRCQAVSSVIGSHAICIASSLPVTVPSVSTMAVPRELCEVLPVRQHPLESSKGKQLIWEVLFVIEISLQNLYPCLLMTKLGEKSADMMTSQFYPL